MTLRRLILLVSLILTFTSSVARESGAQATFVASRAAATTTDLSAFTVVQTGGYATAGDGGGAMFKKVTGTLIDQFFGGGYGSYNGTFAIGSGYTPGVHNGQPLTGGTGVNCMGQVTVNGSGNVSAVVIIVPCVGYVANDILTAPQLPGGGSGFQLKVLTTTTPLGSFADLAGNKWQIISDQGNFWNIKQFGAKVDWHKDSTSATNDTASIQACWSLASFNGVPGQTVDGHPPGNFGYAGGICVHPTGAALFCDNANSSTSNTGLVLPQGVWAIGNGVMSTVLHHCTSTSTGNGNVNPISLCDTVSAVGQFGCRISNMTIEDPQTNGFNVTAVIYSNSGQQQTLGDNLLILTASRGCVKYEIGRGGAANDIWHDIDCELTSASNTNAGFYLNSSTTQHKLTNIVFGCANFPCSTPAAINHLNGRLIADTIDIEGFPTGLNQTVSNPGNNSVYKNVQQNSNGCTQAIILQSTNTPGNILFENVQTACPLVILNGQPGGASYNSPIVKPLTCVGNPCS